MVKTIQSFGLHHLPNQPLAKEKINLRRDFWKSCPQFFWASSSASSDIFEVQLSDRQSDTYLTQLTGEMVFFLLMKFVTCLLALLTGG